MKQPMTFRRFVKNNWEPTDWISIGCTVFMAFIALGNIITVRQVPSWLVGLMQVFLVLQYLSSLMDRLISRGQERIIKGLFEIIHQSIELHTEMANKIKQLTEPVIKITKKTKPN